MPEYPEYANFCMYGSMNPPARLLCVEVAPTLVRRQEVLRKTFFEYDSYQPCAVWWMVKPGGLHTDWWWYPSQWTFGDSPAQHASATTRARSEQATNPARKPWRATRSRR